jgi:putative membrane protein
MIKLKKGEKMIKTEREGFRHLLKISFNYFLLSTGYAVLVFLIEEYYGDQFFNHSTQIGSVFGIAVAFFLGFRMNSAYDRWWEARKIFGELANNSRCFTSKVVTYFNSSESIIHGKELVNLLCNYIKQFELEILSSDFDMKSNENTNNLLLTVSSKIQLSAQHLEPMEKYDLMSIHNSFYDIQGKAERIKRTPFLKVYSIFTRFTVIIYVFLLPF